MRICQFAPGEWSASFDAKDNARACEIAFEAALAQLSELDDMELDHIIDHVGEQFAGHKMEIAEDHFRQLVLEYQQAGRRMLNDLLAEMQRDAAR